MPDRAPDAVVVTKTLPQQALLYHLCGERNVDYIACVLELARVQGWQRFRLAYLRAITAPVLFVEAERTALREDYYPGRLAAVPDLSKVTFAGGHHLHIENPDPMAKAVQDFLVPAEL